MRKFAMLFFLLIVAITSGHSQSGATERSIEVTGEGEVKVDPDIIYLSIELREYKKDGKIVKLEELESQLTKVLQTVGVPPENLKVYASSGRQYDFRIRKNGLLIGKRYKLKLTDIDLLNPLLGELGEAKISAVSLAEITHTEIEKFKTEAKVKAIANAKEKAILLTSALDSKLGQVLQIKETELTDSYPLQSLQGRASGIQLRGTSSFYYQDSYNQAEPSMVDFEQIKLTYKIAVKFKIE